LGTCTTNSSSWLTACITAARLVLFPSVASKLWKTNRYLDLKEVGVSIPEKVDGIAGRSLWPGFEKEKRLLDKYQNASYHFHAHH
jgi:hypothetical protein